MKAIVLKKISPLIDKGAIMIKRGKYGVLEEYDERHTVRCTVESLFGDKTYDCPNFYPWETIRHLKDYYKIVK